MTRGKIMFIDHDGKIYTTIEFNGDMYPEPDIGYGREIILYFKQGGFKNVHDYARYVTRFAEKNFAYTFFSADKGKNHTIWKKTKDSIENELDFLNNRTDYIYVINASNDEIKLRLKCEEMILPVNTMAVVYFDILEDIIHRNNYERDIPLSKSEFVDIIECLRESSELVDQVNELFRNSRENVACDFCNGASLQISHESIVIQLLEKLMRDHGECITYFIHELEYGKNHKFGMMIDKDGNVDIETADKLYDYLVL